MTITRRVAQPVDWDDISPSVDWFAQVATGIEDLQRLAAKRTTRG